MKITLRTFAIAGIAMLAGCAEPYAPEPDAPPLLQPTGFAFTLERTNLAGYVGEIPYTFTNRTGEDVFFNYCEFGPGLQRRAGDDWLPAYGNVIACGAGPPFVVRRGEVVAGTMSIGAGRFGSNQGPQFDTPEVDGEYRLVLNESSAHVGGPEGPPLALPHRASPGFYLTAPEWQPGDGR